MKKKHNQFIIFTMTAFMIFFLTGITVVGLQAYRNIINMTTARLGEVRVGVEIILEHARSASSESSRYRGKSCTPDVLEQLRKIVAYTPNVRSINLFLNRTIYCTTVFGEKEFTDNSHYPKNQMLFLMAGNDLTPYRSLVVFRDPVDSNFGTLIGIDGYYFTNLLQRVGKEPVVSLNIGGKQIDRMGGITRENISSESLVMVSEIFPFSITASVSGKMVLASMIDNDAGSVLIVFFSSLGLAFLFNNFIRTRQSLESQLKRALKDNQFIPYIQPIVSVTSKEIIGGEVLTRWVHPQQGLITPETFIALAEETGIISEITLQIMKLTQECFRNFPGDLPAGLMLNFNVSCSDFRNTNLLESCRNLSRNLADIEPRIILEITERSLYEDVGKIERLVNSLKTEGVQFALDDFGTGSSNLDLIELFRPNYIKIDKNFVRRSINEIPYFLLIKNIINTARNFNCQIVAEGIETQQQQDTLSAHGADYLQGFYYGSPVPLEDFLQYITDKNGY